MDYYETARVMMFVYLGGLVHDADMNIPLWYGTLREYSSIDAMVAARHLVRTRTSDLPWLMPEDVRHEISFILEEGTTR